MMNFLYIPTIADNVAIALLKFQINRVIWFIQIKKKQSFLAKHHTYLPEKIKRLWNDTQYFMKRPISEFKQMNILYENKPNLDVLNIILVISKWTM